MNRFAVAIIIAVAAMAASAPAAELPSSEPAPEAKNCESYGEGFVYVPSTGTCVKIGGYVRGEYTINAPSGGDRSRNTPRQ